MAEKSLKLRNYDINQIIKKIVSVSKKTTLLDARSILLRYKISRILVSENEKPVGILTEKDLVKSIYTLGNKPIESVTVSEIMTKHLITTTDDATLYDCARLMLDNKISSVIILKKDGNLSGIVTKTDLASVFLTQSAGPLQVSKIMTKNVITVKPADSLLYVENVLVKNRISRVVVERNRKPIGVITHRDFIPAKIPLWLRQSGDASEVEKYRMAERPNELNLNQLNYLNTFIAADIMSSNPVTINATDDVSEASLLMIRNGISGLPVVKNSLLAGIITKTDIVRAISTENP
ncbi:MAG TPA: CBS domain-containing protein [Candidatus Nitrosotalea sp.]|nr:CBS domain-containing protein [Candidatus Nitrosotalea sp.]